MSTDSSYSSIDVAGAGRLKPTEEVSDVSDDEIDAAIDDVVDHLGHSHG